MNSVSIITTQSCGKCKYSRGLPSGIAFPPGSPPMVRCRLMPDEQFNYMAGRDGRGEPVIQSKMIPKVVERDDEGCGQYRPRIEI